MAVDWHFTFGEFRFDARTGQLWREDREIKLTPRAASVLHMLAERAPELITKRELFDHVWDGMAVSDDALTSCIKELRQTLGDDSKQPRYIETRHRRGYRLMVPATRGQPRGERKFAANERPSAAAALPVPRSARTDAPPGQQVRFCRTADGVNLAIATCGDGLPVVRAGTFLTHVEHDWRSAVWLPLFARLAAQFKLIRYDPRGCGLSDRDVADISFDAFVRDLETVVDALGLERFALYGISQGAMVSIAYAVRHPERVSRLVLSGGRALSICERQDASELASHDALHTLILNGWGQDNPAFRQVFTSRNWPDTTPDEARSLNELQRVSTSPENAARMRRAFAAAEVNSLLPRVTAPTLVLHSRDDAAVPFELGLMLARAIRGARLVTLDSRNHVPLPEEADWSRYVDEICAFLAENEEDNSAIHTNGIPRMA